RTRTLSDTVAIIGLAQRTARSSHGTTMLWGAMTSGQAFSAFGARAFMGRVLTSDDDAHPDVVVLTFDTWRRTLEGDPNVIGTTIELRAQAGAARLLTVVGVLPADFELPAGALDFYTPVALDPSRPSPAVTMLGRLKPG